MFAMSEKVRVFFGKVRWYEIKTSVTPTIMLHILRRAMATAAAAARPYPFSKTALIRPEPFVPPPAALKQGKGLMPYLYKNLPSPQKQLMLRNLFSRHSPKQLYPGSIITVTADHAPMTFTGVLMAIRRRGPDTSILVRNIIQRTGVEMQFFVNSPHVKDIRVIQKPPKGRMRRAKLYYLRDAPDKMSALAGNKKY
ncbi:translation protein SH3-like domain-containing protein [Mycena epipterygia]|nr:translation protein SH3-like domain-containing protein [Mycena epipterygia]